jgi:hypothetical protein
MGKTYRRDSFFRPKKGKDLNRFKKSNKFKRFKDKNPVKQVDVPDLEQNVV